MSEDLVLIYSIEHGAYWKADSCGYTSNRDFAGKYTRAEAKHICKVANIDVPAGCELNEVIEEIDLNPKNYTSDHVSKSELRAWCEDKELEVRDDFNDFARGFNLALNEILDKFCSGEK